MKYIAHNVKGALMPVAEVVKYDHFLQGKGYENVYLRILGGTLSQRTSNADWSTNMINSWVELQKNNPEVKLIFGVNLNEPVFNVESLYRRFKSAGAIFEGICMGNEWYLSKFVDGDLTKQEVTLRTAYMTPAKYIALCEEYMDIFSEPLIFQFAPLKNQNSDSQRRKANDAVIEATKEIDCFYNIHGYPSPKTGYDFTYLDELKEKTGKRLWVTEFGYGDPTIDTIENVDTVELLKGVKNVADSLTAHLSEGDIVFSQVLWTPRVNPVTDWYNSVLTEKGLLIERIFHTEGVSSAEPPVVEPPVVEPPVVEPPVVEPPVVEPPVVEPPVVEPPAPPTEPAEPTLTAVFPNRKNEWVFYAWTYLMFSEGEPIRLTTRFGRIPFGNEDVGKTKKELRDSI
jgi:hypothetical protein